MEDLFIRAEALLGKDGINKLRDSQIVLFGLGGVGGQVLETLARCGVGKFILIDHDVVNPSNINRQIISTSKNIGMSKTKAAKERVLDINPDAIVIEYQKKIETINDLSFLDLYEPDYIIDAIDHFEGKISIIKYSYARDLAVISSMGAGNKLDMTKFKVSRIEDTVTCPLARKMRQRLKKEGIESLKVVYSTEQPIKHHSPFIGSVSFVPPACGILIAQEVIMDIVFDR